MEELYKNNCHKFSNYFITLKFLYKSQRNDSKNLLVRKTTDEIKILKMLFWFLFRYFLITHEISKTRKKIVFMMFNRNSTRFNETEFEDILVDTSNLWLDRSYFKIKLLKDYCDKLLNNPYMCDAICMESKISSDEYYMQRERTLLIMETIYNKYLESYKNSQTKKIEELQIPTRKSISEQAEKSLENYNESFNNDTLLEKEDGIND